MSLQSPTVPADSAVQHMHAGIDALTKGAWQAALGHFDEAIRFRQSQPWQRDPAAAWMVAAAWINRGDALRRMVNPARPAGAIVSLDHAIAAMAHVPLDRNPAFPDRLILAWINRATTLGEMQDHAAALKDFAKAQDLLECWGATGSPERRFLLAMLAVNRARIHLDQENPKPALQDARTAAEALTGLNAASALIKAYSLQCRALYLILDEPDAHEHVSDWAGMASDAADAALVLVQQSGYHDEWVDDIVRYGARIYRKFFPHFLAEFVRDWMVIPALAKNGALRRDIQQELDIACVDLELHIRTRPQDTEFVATQSGILESVQTARRNLVAKSG